MEKNLQLYEGKHITIDRIEGNIAVCEMPNETIINYKVSELPIGTKEGSVLLVKDSKLVLDEKEYEIRKKRIQDRLDQMFSE